MNKRYRLGEIEEAVAEMEELIDIEDDIDGDFVATFGGVVEPAEGETVIFAYPQALRIAKRHEESCVR